MKKKEMNLRSFEKWMNLVKPKCYD